MLAAAVALVLAASWPPVAEAAGFAGPYIAYMDKFYGCGSGESTGKTVLQMTTTPFNRQRPYELQKLTGNLSVEEAVTDAYWSRVRLDSWSNMEWKQNAMIFNFPAGACSSMRTHLPNAFQILFGDESMRREPCVMPKGVLPFVDQPMNWTFPKFPVLPYGHWRFHYTLGRGRDVDGCFNVECFTIPRGKQSKYG